MMQENRPVAFLVSYWGLKLRLKSIYKKELMAICLAVQKWRHYLLGRHFVSTHFLALKHPFTAFTVAALFMREIVKLHGFPASIVSDQDRIFLSTFWMELFRLRGSVLKRSTSYHPQTESQIEIVNKTLETYLRCFTGVSPGPSISGCIGSYHITRLHTCLQN